MYVSIFCRFCNSEFIVSSVVYLDCVLIHHFRVDDLAFGLFRFVR